MTEHEIILAWLLATGYNVDASASQFEAAGFAHGLPGVGSTANEGEVNQDHQGAAPASDVGEQDVGHASSSVEGDTGVDRTKNRNPCGKCQLDRKKCRLIPGIPFLCHRCKEKGRLICPPHVNYANLRKQCDGARLAQTQAVSELYTFVYENM